MPDKVIFFTVISLMTIGVIFSYSLTPYLMVRYGSGELSFILKQFLFSVISIFLIWTISRLDPAKWLHIIGMTLFIGASVLMVSMNFLPSSIVPEIGGASRWITVFSFSLAPVEFFKIGFIYFISWSMSRRIEYRTDNHYKVITELITFIPYLVIFLISIFFIAILQKDLGQSVILGGTLLLTLYLAGGSLRLITTILGGFLLVFLVFILTFSHRTERISSWWLLAKTWIPDWFANIFGIARIGSEPYQISQALGSIYNGGFWGVDLGNGVFKYGFLAEAHTDFVLEGIAEELGLFSIIIIFGLFATLFQRILKVANRSENRSHLLFNVGIAVIIGLALLINTYGSTGLIPMKGIPVPFISYGGSSMLALAIGIGMVLMTSKYANRQDDKVVKPEIDPQEFMGHNAQHHRPTQNNQREKQHPQYNIDQQREYHHSRPHHQNRDRREF